MCCRQVHRSVERAAPSPDLLEQQLLVPVPRTWFAGRLLDRHIAERSHAIRLGNSARRHLLRLSRGGSGYPRSLLAHVGGAMSRVPANATAWPNRDAHFIMNAHTRWREPAQDKACIAWARQLFEATAPYASGSVYINFMPDDENDRVEKAYGPNYRRLTEIKRRYDPHNLFRVNQNIRPGP